MTPSEIAGHLMILASKLETENRSREANACAEGAALILVYLDRTRGMGIQAYDRTITSTADTSATIKPLFGSILKKDL